MADLVRLAYYPFLPEVPAAIADVGPGVADLLGGARFEGARRRGQARIEGALEDKTIAPVAIRDDASALTELLSVPVARMLAVVIGDRALIRRYGEAEGARLGEHLKRDPTALPAVVAALDIDADEEDGWRIHFADYLRVAPVHMPKWKLVNQTVDGGYLVLDDARMAALCEQALAARITTELEAERQRPVPTDLREAMAPYVDALMPRLEKARENWQTGDFGPVQRHLFPPCIMELFAQMKRGEMVPHHGRFAMASFLATIGMTSQDIVDYFSEIPNFDPDKSMYQITHIAGEQGVEKYTPPGCATMQTNGICPLDKRDNLCMKIKHPLSYYRARIRFQKQDQEKAKALAQSGGAA